MTDKLKYFVINLILVVLLISCQKTPNTKECQKSKVSQKILSQTAKKLAAKHNIRCVGYAYGIMYEVEELGFRFYVHRSLDIDSARSLILDCAQELVTAVRKNHGIQPYLLETGFNIENVDIAFFINPDGERNFYPEIGVVSLVRGKIKYNGYDKEFFETHHVPEYVCILKETYQEALEKLSQNQ